MRLTTRSAALGMAAVTALVGLSARAWADEPPPTEPALPVVVAPPAPVALPVVAVPPAPVALPVVVAQPALVEAPAKPAWTPRAQQNRVSLETAFWTASSGDATVFALVAQLRLTEHLVLDLEAPWAFTDEYSSDGTEARDLVFGNHTVGLHYAALAGDAVGLWAGAFLAAPVLLQPSDPQVLAVPYMARARVLYNGYWFAPEVIPFGFRGGVEARLLPFLSYRGEVAAIVYAAGSGYTPGADQSSGTGFSVEQGNELFARAPIGLLGGVRVQEVFMVTGSDDPVQVAIEPFAGYEPKGRGVFARLGVLFALNGALGFGANGAQVITPRLTVGASF